MTTVRVVVELEEEEARYLVASSKTGSVARFVGESVAGAVLDEYEWSGGGGEGTARVVVDGSTYCVSRALG